MVLAFERLIGVYKWQRHLFSKLYAVMVLRVIKAFCLCVGVVFSCLSLDCRMCTVCDLVCNGGSPPIVVLSMNKI